MIYFYIVIFCMANEWLSSSIWLDEWWYGVREDVNKVTEEAVRRVQEDNKKAQQVWQEIKKDKDKNNKIAKFLWFLLKSIDDDLVEYLYKTFFLIQDHKTNLTHINKNINMVLLIWLFAPFYGPEIREHNIQEYFESFVDLDSSITLSQYVWYAKKIIKTYDNNTDTNKKNFLELILKISKAYELTAKLSIEAHHELRKSVSKELWGHDIW